MKHKMGEFNISRRLSSITTYYYVYIGKTTKESAGKNVYCLLPLYMGASLSNSRANIRIKNRNLNFVTYRPSGYFKEISGQINME